MKKLIFCFVFLVLVFQAFTTGFAKTLYIDGKYINYTAEPVRLFVEGIEVVSDMEPIILEERTLVPARAVFSMLGAGVLWDGAKRQVTIEFGDKTVLLTIDSKTALINGKPSKDMDVPAKIINDRTMIPVRFVSENLGFSVSFDDIKRIVYISEKAADAPEKPSDDEKEPETPENAKPDDAVAEIVKISGRFLNNNYILEIESTEPIAKYETLSLSNPERFVVDIKNSVLKTDKTYINVNEGIVKKVRFSDFDPDNSVVRIVADTYIAQKPEVTLSADKKTMYLTFKPQPLTNKSFVYKKASSSESLKITLPSKAGYKYFSLENPNRIVIDINNQLLSDLFKDVTLNGEIAKGLRVAQFNDSTLRVVVDVYDMPEYKVSGNENVISLTLSKSSLKDDDDENDNEKDTENEDEDDSEDDSEDDGEKVPSATLPSKAEKLSDFVVCIDAGHGGSDPGTIGYDENGKTVLLEKDANLDISLRLEKILKDYGIKTVMTRTTDVYLGLTERTDIANNAGAHLNVCVHNNAAEATAANGTEILYGASYEYEGYNISGKQYAKNVLDALVKALGTQNRGLLDSPRFVAINSANMPSIIVESVFVSNPKEQELLLTGDFRQKIAGAIAEGVVKTLNEALK